MRQTFDPDAPPLPPHGAPPIESRLPCMICRLPTPHADLRLYGARCYPCYEAYKREPQPKQHYSQAGQMPTAREAHGDEQ